MESYFYLVTENFAIGDIEFIPQSERTIDIKLNELANNEALLTAFRLVYLTGSTNKSEWFAGYLSAFNSDNYEEKYKKLRTNPMLRILITNSELFEKIKQI